MRLTKRGKKRLVILVVVGGILIAGAAAAAIAYPMYRDNLARQARVDGLALYEKGEYEAALPKLSFYVARLGRESKDVETIVKFADTRRKVPQPNGKHLLGAIGMYQFARALDPQNLAALEGLLEVYRDTGRLAELEQTAESVLAIDADHIRALEAKTAALRGNGRYSEAEESAARLVALQPESFPYRALLLDIAGRGGASEAELLAICDTWIAEEEIEDGRLLLIKAIALAMLQRLDEARTLIQEAALRGAGEEVLPVMADWLERLDLRDEARDLIVRSRDQYQGQTWFHQFIIEREWRGGRIAAAQAELTQAEGLLGEDDLPLLRMQAVLHTLSDRREDALQAVGALEKAAERAPFNERDAYRACAMALRARIEHAETDWRQAIAGYEEAQSLSPDDELIHFFYGEAMSAVGEVEQAAMHFSRACPEASSWVAAGGAYVQSLMRMGRAEDAYAAAQDLIARTNPQILEPWLLWFEAWLALDESGLRAPEVRDGGEEPPQLVAALEQFRGEAPQSSEVVRLLMRAYLVHNQLERAQQLAREAMGNDEAPADLLVDYADLLALADRELADQLLARAAERGATAETSAMLQARLAAADGRAEQGLAILDAALAESELAPIGQLRLRLEYATRADMVGVEEMVRELIEHNDVTASDLAGVLAIDATWTDKVLIDRAIERLKELAGDDSMRVQLAEAGRTLRFEPDNEEAVADAVIALDDLLRRLPDSLPARTLMAALVMLGDDPDEREAARHLRAAVDRYPNQINLYPRLIQLLQRQGDVANAQRYLALLERQQSGADLERAQLQLFQMQGDFDSAIAQLSGMLTEESPETDRLLMAGLMLKAGRIDDARRAVDDVLRRFGGSWLTLRFAANFYAAQGQFQRGLDLLKNADVEGGESARALLLGTFYHQQGYPDEATEWLTEVVEIDPSNEAGWEFLAQHHLARENYALAKEAAVQGLQVNEENESLRVVLASVGLAMGSKERKEAIATFRELRGDNTALIDTMVLFDRVIQPDDTFSTDPDDLEDAQALTEKHPSFLPAWRLAVMMHDGAGKRVEAVSLARQALAKLPTEAEPAIWASELLHRAGQFSEALDMAQTWRQRTLEDPIAADMMIARLHIALRNPQMAYQSLSQHAVRIEMERDRAAMPFELWLRTLLLNREFQRALSLVEGDPQGRRWLPVWLDVVRFLDPPMTRQALRTIEPAALESPAGTINLALAWTLLGDNTDDAADFDQADRLAVSVSDIEDVRVEAMQLRAAVSDARGEREEAVSLYCAVLEESPGDLMTLNNLAYILGPKLGRYDEALPYSSEAATKYPNMPDVLDTHALVLLGLNRFADAEQAARAAQRMRPEDPGILLTLTDVLIKSGDKMVEARQMLDRARQILNAAPVRDPDLEERLLELEAMVS